MRYVTQPTTSTTLDSGNTRGRTVRSTASILLLVSSGLFLVGLQEKLLGWVLFSIGLGILTLIEQHRAGVLLLPYLLLATLGVTSIGTELTNRHMATMGALLAAAILLPAVFDRKMRGGTSVLKFSWRMGRPWNQREKRYIALTIVLAYLVLPFYLRETGAYLNWRVDATEESIARLFVGTNAVGLWDELAFIVVTLGVLRRFLPFLWANLLQAVLFTSFLYELGFTSWGPSFVFPFAYLQGLVFRNTDSIAYVVTIHLSLDFVLFLAIINAHHPELCAVFLT